MKSNIGITKRIISLMLCFAIVLGSMPTMVFAELGSNWWQDLSENKTDLTAQGSYTIKNSDQIVSGQDVLVFATRQRRYC